MEVSVAEAKNKLTKLLRAVEEGEEVVITRRGKPVVQLVRIAPKRKVKLGWMKGRIKLHSGWDDPMTLEEFFGHRL